MHCNNIHVLLKKKIANYNDLLIMLDQIHDLIVIFKSDPDSVVQNNSNYVNA